MDSRPIGIFDSGVWGIDCSKTDNKRDASGADCIFW